MKIGGSRKGKKGRLKFESHQRNALSDVLYIYLEYVFGLFCDTGSGSRQICQTWSTYHILKLKRTESEKSDDSWNEERNERRVMMMKGLLRMTELAIDVSQQRRPDTRCWLHALDEVDVDPLPPGSLTTR